MFMNIKSNPVSNKAVFGILGASKVLRTNHVFQNPLIFQESLPKIRFYSTSTSDPNKSTESNNLKADLDEKFVEPSNVINKDSTLYFNVTERAVKRLADIFKESKQSLKISVESGGCHGFQYNLKLIPFEELTLIKKDFGDNLIKSSKNDPLVTKNSDSNADELDDELDDEMFDDFDMDEVPESSLNDKKVIYEFPNSAAIVTDKSSLKILNKTYLTYTTELIGSTFKIKGGNMKSSCGCGSSFDVDI
ncbi:hypothetical protein TPHA_0A03590 [Tetrapisispora phaffii CBS 4417]|uniref:FeS cluster biogenesis domain-containing protein n=1 Tax=Tetrapisispora phaffii (strain ATCC 24235 / CBS 4417 / NBRC 1672 / NRRL Y-8282 / UCD 70-5) TaxID=1071381 RepID=G8BNF7_TETPH|nr:hypothetical protein TPHA_0A03590 [Tetrapisispora phaffii CBS 4417]CCE61435.1 hypothetical protein TPHA_0A03590 [Tetrapisispora phaffii CBS 4417]